MSAECLKHGCDLTGFLEDATCPQCDLELALASVEKERDKWEAQEKIAIQERDEAREALEKTAEALDSGRVLKELEEILTSLYWRGRPEANRLDYAVQGVKFALREYLRPALENRTPSPPSNSSDLAKEGDGR